MKQRLISALALWTLGSTVLFSAEIKIANDRLTPPKKSTVNTPAVPPKWKITQGKPEHCVHWQSQNQRDEAVSHTAIRGGTELRQTITVAELTEKETKVKGDWSGVIAVDTLGISGKGSVSWKLTLTDNEGKIVERLSGRASRTADASNPKTTRVWAHVPPAKLKSLFGKKLTLTLNTTGTGSIVVSAVSFCRLHSQPSGKLFGRSNGGVGPDLLGAGSLGFDGLTEHRQRVLSVMKIRKGLPAEKAGLKVGDRIIAVNRNPLPNNNLAPGWDWLYNSHESVLGRAVAAAWSKQPPVGKGIVELGLLRGNKVVNIRCQLSQKMDFTDITSSEYRAKLNAELIGYLVKNQRQDGSWRGPIRTTFAALSLLATQDPAHAPRVKRAVDWMLNKYPEPEKFGNLGFWHGSYAGILYCEYYLATGDARVLPRVRSLLEWISSGTHTSKWGMQCLGHGVGGLPYGQKALVAPATHALVVDSLAERCGIESGLWDTLLPYMEHSWSDPAKGGHGSLGYNASYKDKGEFWSRSGLFSIAAHLRNERSDMENAMISFMRGHYPWLRNSHAYGEPGGSLGLLALNLCEPDAYNDVMKAIGWWFALAWEPGYGLRFTTPHMGAPYMGTDDLINATYALVLAAPQKTLTITGSNKRNWLDVSHLPTPASPVIIRRDQQGNVTLACRIPGPPIRFTTDGSEPNKNSPLYQKPIPLSAGGTVKARAYPSGIKPSETTSVNYGPAKAQWKVLAASGHADPNEAIRRASHAIDHSSAHSWLTDVGQDAKGYPHYLVLDLGSETDLSSLTLDFIRDSGGCKKCVVKTSTSLTSKPQTVATAEWTTFQNQQRVSLSKPIKARYLRLEFEQPVKENAISLMIREIEINQ